MRSVVVFLALACVAFAVSNEELLVTSVSVTMPTNGPVERNDLRPTFVTPVRPTKTDLDIDIDKIVAIGKIIWDIVKAGKPVVDYKTDWAGAIPKGTEWQDLENFKDMTYGPFGWIFKNKLGVTTVEFKFHFAFTCKGSYNGHGSFLMNVGTAIEKIYAAWGFTVNIVATVDKNIINYGTKIDPIAGLAVEVTLENKSVLQSFTERCRVTLRGDCTANIISCSQ